MIAESTLARYDALLFDCDGTLADTMPLHYRAWRTALDPLRVEFPETLFHSWGGTPTRRIAEQLSARSGVAFDPAAVSSGKESIFLSLLDGVQPIAPVRALAIRAHALGKRIAVVSGGRRDIVQRTLVLIGIADYFETLVCSEDTVRGKPAPDPFLEAARRLNVAPAQCLVFEDSETGSAAAHGAGMECIRVDLELSRAG